MVYMFELRKIYILNGNYLQFQFLTLFSDLNGSECESTEGQSDDTHGSGRGCKGSILTSGGLVELDRDVLDFGGGLGGAVLLVCHGEVLFASR